MGENAEYAETVHPFSKPFALSLFFAILYFIAKGRGKREIRGNHISIFAAFRAFVFFAIIYLSRKNAENAEYANTIYHFSKSFALSLYFAILYFIAKGRGKREIRGNHMSIFAIFRFFSQSFILSRKDAEYAEYAKNIWHFSQPFALSHYFAIIYFIAKGRGKRGKRGNLGIYFGGNNRASFEHLRFICASYLNGD